MKKISENIKKYRELKKISQRKLADKLNVDTEEIVKYENGEIDMTISTLRNMSLILKVSIYDLIGEKDKDIEILIESIRMLYDEVSKVHYFKKE